MIYKKKARRIYKNLKGFVNKKTVEKYINKNQKLTDKNCKINSSKLHNLLIIFMLFCSSLFLYHLYTLWQKYKNDKNNNNNNNLDLNIVPLSGIY